jgi:hypothetical protein
VVGFLNPDTLPLPGALAALLAALDQDARVGAAGPRTWWDETRTFLLPPPRLPTLADLLARRLGRRVGWVGRGYSRRLARWAFGIGHAGRTAHLAMLSGAFLLARRSVVEEIGGFDPGFPLYFEDADWCRRVRRAGYRLAYVPAAEVVHHFDQSAQRRPAQAEAWRAESLRHYLRKYYGAAGPRVQRLLERAGRGPTAPPSLPVTELGECAAPPWLTLPPGTGALQVAYDWLFFDAALGLAAGPEWRLPEAIWRRLRPRRYFVRALDRTAWRPLALWTWEKR